MVATISIKADEIEVNYKVNYKAGFLYILQSRRKTFSQGQIR